LAISRQDPTKQEQKKETIESQAETFKVHEEASSASEVSGHNHHLSGMKIP